MKPYGFHRPDPGIPNEHDKGSERLRTRLELQKALGPVPPSLTAKDSPPCTCEDCTSDPAFAVYVRELEQEEHSHLDEIQI